MLISEHLISAVVGLASGIVGTFIAPWVNWGVEKRRRRMEQHRVTIARWRKTVNDIFGDEEASGWSDGGKREFDLAQYPEFTELRLHLSERTLSLIRSNDSFDHEVSESIHADITKHEKDWGLF